VSRQLEVGNHKRRTLNTRLSSGTSAGTFACPAGPYRNCRGEAGTKNEPNLYFVPNPKKDPKIDLHISNPKSREFLFRRVRSTINFEIEWLKDHFLDLYLYSKGGLEPLEKKFTRS